LVKVFVRQATVICTREERLVQYLTVERVLPREYWDCRRLQALYEW
jgi:hypothetical protein